VGSSRRCRTPNGSFFQGFARNLPVRKRPQNPDRTSQGAKAKKARRSCSFERAAHGMEVGAAVRVLHDHLTVDDGGPAGKLRRRRRVYPADDNHPLVAFGELGRDEVGIGLGPTAPVLSARLVARKAPRAAWESGSREEPRVYRTRARQMESQAPRCLT